MKGTFYTYVPAGGWLVFGVEPCDFCGKDMQAANTVTAFGSRRSLERAGSKPYTPPAPPFVPGFLEPPPEGCLVEESGEVVCEPCYLEAF